jgi:serine acetyltransferase
MGGVESMLRELRDSSHPRLTLAQALVAVVPAGMRERARPALLRGVAGMRIGSGTALAGRLTVLAGTRGHVRRIEIGNGVSFGAGVVLNPDEVIRIGPGCSVGDGVLVYTTTHRMGPSTKRCLPGAIAGRVEIGARVTIGARSIVLPGAIVGDGASIAPGSLVSGRVEGTPSVIGS